MAREGGWEGVLLYLTIAGSMARAGGLLVGYSRLGRRWGMGGGYSCCGLPSFDGWRRLMGDGVWSAGMGLSWLGGVERR